MSARQLFRPLFGEVSSREVEAALEELRVKRGTGFFIGVLEPEARTPGSLDEDMRGGNSGDATSKASAEANFPRSGSQRYRVFTAVLRAGEHGLTSDEIAATHAMRLYSVKPRLTELRKYGAVTKRGTRKTVTGAESDIYVVTAKGREEARARGLS